MEISYLERRSLYRDGTQAVLGRNMTWNILKNAPPVYLYPPALRRVGIGLQDFHAYLKSVRPIPIPKYI